MTANKSLQRNFDQCAERGLRPQPAPASKSAEAGVIRKRGKNYAVDNSKQGMDIQWSWCIYTCDNYWFYG